MYNKALEQMCHLTEEDGEEGGDQPSDGEQMEEKTKESVNAESLCCSSLICLDLLDHNSETL